MSKTLLAVDDSATMRKVLEITFSGEDFKVITADGRAAALAKMNDEPDVVVLDTSLGGDDAYALAKELRAKSSKATIVLLASRYNAYDANKGRDAGADDFMDKPFDTQQLIDKVKKAIVQHESGGAPKAAAAAAPAVSAVPTSTSPSMQSPFAQPKAVPAAAATQPGAGGGTPAAPKVSPAAASPSRTHTLSFEGTPPPRAVAEKPAAAAPPMRAPSASRPDHVPAKTTPSTTAQPAQASVGAQVNGQLAGKLSELGLSPAQADAVLALSREVVERVVWEVVPQIAEAIIKEEIARLTKEG